MLLITKPSENRVDIELSAPIDAEMMRIGLDDLIEKSKDVTGGIMLYRITSFAMPTFGALMVEMTRLPGLFGLLGKFDRCAVVTDTAWLRTASEIEGAFLPGLRIKAFDLKDTALAEAWLNHVDDTDDDEKNVPV